MSEELQTVEVIESTPMTPMDRLREKNKEVILQHLEDSFGIVTEACKRAGISRMSFYRYMNDPAFKSRAEEIAETAKDYAEGQLFKRMKEGSDAAIIFFLKTKAKDRGYIENRQVDITSGGEKITRPVFKLPDGSTIEL